MKARSVQHDHAAGWPCRKPHIMEIAVHYMPVETAFKHHRREKRSVMPRPDDTRAPAFATAHMRGDAFPAQGPCLTAIEPVVDAGFVHERNGPRAHHQFKLPLEEPTVEFTVRDGFFLM